MPRRSLDVAAPVVGPARVDRRTKNLIKRIEPGDVAVIDHKDLDRIAAEGLIESRVGAIVNAAPSISGRYPNVGPLLIAAAGIPLVDDVGPAVMDAVREGQLVRLAGTELQVDGSVVARGERQSLQSLEARYDAAKRTMGDELERFAMNTLEYLQRERHFAIEPVALPELSTTIARRHVLIVVRGFDYKDDLAHLRHYVHEMRPVLIGVDGGADALLEDGYRPDVVIGDMDSVSEAALRSGAEIVLHAYPGGYAPGRTRLESLGLPYVTVEASGTSEDVAFLLAHEKRAELIVAVGSHGNLREFLDKGREGMASTFLVRLRVGEILVDAKGVSRMYRGGVRGRDVALLVGSALLAILVVALASEPFRLFLRQIAEQLRNFVFEVQQLF